MGFSLGEESDHGMTEINLLPLIDIMLVLMIIFLVTASVANPSILVNLPNTNTPSRMPPPEQININVTASNQFAVNGVMMSLPELNAALKKAAQQPRKPTLMLKADKEARYDSVAQVMAQAGQAGLTEIAFVSQAP